MEDTSVLKWWSLSINEVLEKLSSQKSGLSSQEANKRLLIYGKNEIESKEKTSSLIIFISQFKNWLTAVLVIASIISFFLGEKIDSIVILVLVFLSSFFGFIQEYKAEKTLLKLKKYLKNKATVYRDGRLIKIDSADIVPGDILNLRIGDIVAADARLISGEEFLTNESVLTGESLPVMKLQKISIPKDSTISEMKNMVFMGTSVFQGNAVGVVVETGKNTEFGKISETIKDTEPKTDFQDQINNFSKFLFRVIVLMTVFIFISNVILNKGFFPSFLFAVALAVGIAPEMLPAIITVTLSQGALKMAKKKVVVKRLSAVEDFGNIDTLCIDKTGTLTQGIFSLDDYFDNDGKKNDLILLYSMLCTSGISKGSFGISNPTDKAIWESSFSQNQKKLLSNYKILDENEFDYERKRMSVLVHLKNENILISKGSSEAIASVSKYIRKNEKDKLFDKKSKKVFIDEVNKYEKNGFRVIAVASKNIDKKDSTAGDENKMTLLGILLFNDPIKETTKDAIKKFIFLGINLKVISGDSLTVTKSMAKEAGISFSEDQIVTGDILKNCSDENFRTYAKKCLIFAKLTPDQKFKIVRFLNYEGHTVGFLGDGVNDAPALREADVGITVDTGSDIAKEASDIVLLEKDLKVLVDGIEAGRKTFGNIMKYILNTISANYGNMFTVAISSLFLKFIPLLPSQILLNNFTSDIPLFAVATDNVDSGFMKKPNKWNISYIKNFMVTYGFVSTLFDFILILPMAFVFKVNTEVFRTAWFVESSISEMIITFVIRTKLPFYRSKPSRALLLLTIVSIVFVISMPFIGKELFSFTHLPYYVWILIAIDLVCYFTLTEIVKKRFFHKLDIN